MPRNAIVSIAASMALHALLLGLAAMRPGQQAAPYAARAALHQGLVRQLRGNLDVRGRRLALIARAREELSASTLRLGAFVLEGNELDAMEAGLPFELEQSRARYGERVTRLREALARHSMTDAVPEVFGDLRYIGRPGGMMAEALQTLGGSCEQLSVLIAAAAYDAGHREVGLRFYGGAGPHGVAHVAPVLTVGAREHDLVAGKTAFAGGVRVEAAHLIDIYARAHGLLHDDPRRPSGPGASEGAEQGNRSSLVSGFPANADVFPGELPLYAARAVQLPGTGGWPAESEEPEPAHDARRCGYYVRMAVLDPSVVQVDAGGGHWMEVEPRRMPQPERLSAQAAMLRQAWQVARDRSAREGDRMMAYACVAAVGELAAIEFALSGEPELARESMSLARQASREGSVLVKPWSQRSESERVSIRMDLSEHAGRTWLLLLLEGGDRVVVDLLERVEGKGWGKVSSLAGLIVWPATRERALAMIERYPLEDQVDVMHEMYHTHDHMAPWASDFDMEVSQGQAAKSSFLRAWRVFRGLAWRVWNGRRPVEELLNGLISDSDRAGLRPDWQAALLEYTARNVLGLQAMRSSDLAPVVQLRRAAERIAHPTMTSLSRRLAFIEAQGGLTGPSLADAWQMK